MHPLIEKDLWNFGKEKFLEKDMLAIREEARDRRALKSSVRSCIIRDARERENTKEVNVPSDIDYMSSLQKKVRSVPNNLGLS